MNFDPTSWTAEGGTINLDEVARAAVIAYCRARAAEDGPLFSVRNWLQREADRLEAEARDV